jgi:hypothetical protein
MRKRERERKTTTTQKVHGTNNGGSDTHKAFSEHTHKAFSALRDARGVGVAGVGVACRAWLGVGLVVVVVMSFSVFTARAG